MLLCLKLSTTSIQPTLNFCDDTIRAYNTIITWILLERSMGLFDNICITCVLLSLTLRKHFFDSCFEHGLWWHSHLMLSPFISISTFTNWSLNGKDPVFIPPCLVHPLRFPLLDRFLLSKLSFFLLLQLSATLSLIKLISYQTTCSLLILTPSSFPLQTWIREAHSNHTTGWILCCLETSSIKWMTPLFWYSLILST